jgi:hypothetical protein
MPERLEPLITFGWTACFAAAAATFQVLLDAYNPKNDGRVWTRREIIRNCLHIVSIAFWGGLSGWAVEQILPGASGQFLGIVAAVLGSGGHNAMRLFMTGVVEKALGVKVVIDDRPDVQLAAKTVE